LQRGALHQQVEPVDVDILCAGAISDGGHCAHEIGVGVFGGDDEALVGLES
jgi:hypothetical protein